MNDTKNNVNFVVVEHKRQLMKSVVNKVFESETGMGKILFTVFLLYFFPFMLSAQRAVSGRITNANDGTPIPGAAVFIANTTVGTTTDAEGYYELKIPGEGSYQLVVSHVGYQPVFRETEPGRTLQTLDVVMHEHELDEVKIAVKVQARKKDINLFWEKILGTKPSNQAIQVLNPEAAFFYYNSQTQKLTVTSRVPLQIINHETGYQIQCVLNYFTHNYNTDLSSWQLQPMFTELEPKNLKQQQRWESNRKKVYQFSIANFIKSLYDDSLPENGFLLVKRDVVTRKYQQIDMAEFLTTDTSAGAKSFYIQPDDWTIVLYCFGKQVTPKNLQEINGYKGMDMIGLFRNMLKTPGDSVRIFPDGTYSNPILLSPLFSSESLSGLDKILPVDYEDTKTFSLSDARHPVKQKSDSELNNLSPLIQALQDFSNNIPHEKVYLHFDNTSYYQSDPIWFKCYVTSAQHQLSDLSKTLYVELLNPGGEIVDQRILKIENGQCHGNFTLEHLPFYSGFYEVRAYTKYMLNFGDDIIFSRLLPVFDKPKEESNFEEKNMLKYTRWGIRNYPMKREPPEREKKVNLRFFPEGGNLVQGVASRVAFEATDEAGNPIDVTGVVTDGAKQELCQFSGFHEGRGVFTYAPGVSSRNDVAEVEYSGKKYRFDLPSRLPQGVVMEVDNLTYPDSIVITLRKNSATPPGILGIAVMNGGRLQNAYLARIEEDENYFLIDKTLLSSGVSQIVLFNSKGEILCDRLIFTNLNQLLTGELIDVKAKTGKTSYHPHELVDMELWIADREANPVQTTFSLSVRDGENEVESNHNILTDLLLMSEIRGYVRNPAYYFEKGDDPALDVLLMVQGWRRYSWKQMAGVESFEMKYLPEQGIETHGNVVSFVRQKPQPDVDVSMMLIKKGDENENGGSFLETFVTDEKGSFSFMSDVSGRWSMILTVSEKGKKKDHRILLDRVFSPEPKRYRYADMQVSIAKKSEENKDDDETSDDLEDDSESFLKAYRDSIAKLGINEKVHQIDEVTIKGKRNSTERDILRNRTTSVTFYDVPAEMDNFFDQGKYIGEDIHEFMRNMNEQFKIRRYEGEEILEYKQKWPLFVINYKPVDFSDPDAKEFEYFKYKAIRVNAIRSIYINETLTAMCQYVILPPLEKCIDLIQEYSCVVFIETWPEGKIPAEGAKGVRKTWLEGYSAVKEFYSPDYSTLPPVPDYRCTLYWNPSVTTGENGKANIKFYNNSRCTNFSISAETVTEEGWIGVCANE